MYDKKYLKNEKNALYLHPLKQMVIVAQLVRASDCGSEGRGFETPHSPWNEKEAQSMIGLFLYHNIPIFFTIRLSNFSLYLHTFKNKN